MGLPQANEAIKGTLLLGEVVTHKAVPKARREQALSGPDDTTAETRARLIRYNATDSLQAALEVEHPGLRNSLVETPTVTTSSPVPGTHTGGEHATVSTTYEPSPTHQVPAGTEESPWNTATSTTSNQAYNTYAGGSTKTETAIPSAEVVSTPQMNPNALGVRVFYPEAAARAYEAAEVADRAIAAAEEAIAYADWTIAQVEKAENLAGILGERVEALPRTM